MRIYECEQRITACLGVSPSLCPRPASESLDALWFLAEQWMEAASRKARSLCQVHGRHRSPETEIPGWHCTGECRVLVPACIRTHCSQGRASGRRTQTIRKRWRTVQGSIGIHSGAPLRQLMSMCPSMTLRIYRFSVYTIASASSFTASPSLPASFCQSASLLPQLNKTISPAFPGHSGAHLGPFPVLKCGDNCGSDWSPLHPLIRCVKLARLVPLDHESFSQYSSCQFGEGWRDS
ncbi:hypothetical protein J3E68DRAFT_155902 [Trichoderma sp. SZMC 28012]